MFLAHNNLFPQMRSVQHSSNFEGAGLAARRSWEILALFLMLFPKRKRKKHGETTNKAPVSFKTVTNNKNKKKKNWRLA